MRNIIEGTADDLGKNGWDRSFGWGRINVYSAVLAAQESEPAPTPSETPTPTPTPTPSPTPTPEPGTMHVGDLDGSNMNQGRTWIAEVAITIHDASHALVANVTVNGTWTGGVSGAGSCKTDGSGQCTVTSGGILKRNGSATFTVDIVSDNTLIYSSNSNHDPDGDSDGTSITVYKP